MNKADLVEAVRGEVDLSRTQAEAAVDAVMSSVMSAVSSGERVTVAGFGTFNPASRAARTGRNPQTGEPVRIAASKSVRFSPASAFKQSLNPRRAKKAVAKKATAKRATKKQAATARRAATKAPAKKVTKATRKR